MDRRLATIFAADVVGFSARTQRDEADTLTRLKLLKSLVEAELQSAGARVVNWAGDGLLAEFGSAVAAVRAGHAIQCQLAAPSARVEIGLELRIGVHLADVVVEGEDLLGDGVNVAVRIEGEATPGRVFLSRTVLEHVENHAQLAFEPVGLHQMKNIAEPMELFAVLGEVGNHSWATAMDQPGAQVAEAPRSDGVVIVPFVNMSNDPEQEYFAEGFTDDLLTELPRFPDVHVVARNACFGLKGTHESVAEICRRTGARYCLEGGVRRLGNRVRISGHLTDSQTGKEVWSERYDCQFDELFDVQDDMVAKIASAAAGHVARTIEAEVRRKVPEEMAAHDCLMRGLVHHRLGGVTRDHAVRALEWFERALELDPEYGRAHAWRACAYATLAEWDGREYKDDCWEIARKALELNPNDAEVHRNVGSLCLYKAEFERSLHHFQRAIEIMPNHAYIVAHVGNAYNYLGDGNMGLEYQRRAEALDPSLPEYCREVGVISHYVLGDYEACYAAAVAFPRPTRRATAYRAAAAVHLDEERLARAVRRLSIIDPEFAPEQILPSEVFREEARNRQLAEDLAKACATMPRAEPHLVSVGQ